MKIELRHVGHTNKGAELMLRAMIDHFAGREGVELVGNHRVCNAEQRKTLGVSGLLFWRVNDATSLVPPSWLVPGPLRHALGYVHPRDIDLVLDGAGFAYGDAWGPQRAQQSADYYAAVKARGGRVVLMPQSFGPFKKPEVAAATRALIDASDLVFARDSTAFAALTELLGTSPKIVQAPDFTPLVKGVLPRNFAPGPKPAAIIPNQKMVEQTDTGVDTYVQFIATVARAFAADGCTPFLLPHAIQDGALIEKVRLATDGAFATIVEPDALRLKGMIGACHVVMCSRFHGIVSALCQGVPVVATGWSHKYRHLLGEYESPELLVSPTTPLGEVTAMVERLLEPTQYAATRARLESRAQWHRDEATRMWAQVDALLAG